MQWSWWWLLLGGGGRSNMRNSSRNLRLKVGSIPSVRRLREMLVGHQAVKNHTSLVLFFFEIPCETSRVESHGISTSHEKDLWKTTREKYQSGTLCKKRRSDVRIYSGQRWKRLGNSLELQNSRHKVTTQTKAVENPGSLLKMIPKRNKKIACFLSPLVKSHDFLIIIIFFSFHVSPLGCIQDWLRQSTDLKDEGPIGVVKAASGFERLGHTPQERKVVEQWLDQWNISKNAKLNTAFFSCLWHDVFSSSFHFIDAFSYIYLSLIHAKQIRSHTNIIRELPPCHAIQPSKAQGSSTSQRPSTLLLGALGRWLKRMLFHLYVPSGNLR